VDWGGLIELSGGEHFPLSSRGRGEGARTSDFGREPGRGVFHWRTILP